MTEGVLTIEILNETIASIKKPKSYGEVVGFKINPADLRDLEGGLVSYSGIVNNSLVMIPPYRGLRLEPDVTQPRGYVEPIRRG